MITGDSGAINLIKGDGGNLQRVTIERTARWNSVMFRCPRCLGRCQRLIEVDGQFRSAERRQPVRGQRRKNLWPRVSSGFVTSLVLRLCSVRR